MDEREWMACADPATMLASVRDKVSDRRLRLFACAVCRFCWHLLTDERSRQAVEVAELYADGATSTAALHRTYQAAIPLLTAPHGTARERLAADAAVWACAPELRLPANHGAMTWRALADFLPAVDQSALLRDLVGNPLRPVKLARECGRCHGRGTLTQHLTDAGGEPYDSIEMYCKACLGDGRVVPPWRTPTVLSLARAAYEERLPNGFLDPERLAVLSDALEEAGCEDRAILRHLRGEEVIPSPHMPKLGLWGALRGPHTRGCWATDLLLGRE